MSTRLLTGCDPFRVILMRRDATELLLTWDRVHLALPVVEVPRYSRIAQECTAAVKNQWGLQACCLDTRTSPAAGNPQNLLRYALLEIYRSCRTPKGMDWVPAASLSPSSFEDSADFDVITRALADRTSAATNSAFLGKPGWFREVFDWTASQAAPLGLRLSGEFRQLNASPTFSLLRFATNGPALWFKAVGEPNVREFRLSLTLARLFPGFVPRVVASREDWNAWLSLEIEGETLDQTLSTQGCVRAVESLAALQIASLGNEFHLIEAGCRDSRAGSLGDLVDPFFTVMAEHMAEQTKPSPLPLSRQEVASLAVEIKSSLEGLTDTDIPPALGHLDFNPGNIVVCPDHCVFLDWAEASVGHPFFTFQYLLEHARRLRGDDPQAEKLLVSSYARSWAFFASPDNIARAIRMAPLLAAFAFAAVGLPWQSPDSNQRRAIAPLLRSLARRLKRESDALQNRRSACVP